MTKLAKLLHDHSDPNYMFIELFKIERERLVLVKNNSSESKINELKTLFQAKFKIVYDHYVQNDFLLSFSNFDMYVKNYENLKQKFFKEFPDALLENFVTKEIKKLNDNHLTLTCYYVGVLDNEDLEQYYGETLDLRMYLDDQMIDKITYSHQRKTKFLESKIDSNSQIKDEILDLSNNNNPSKIIFMNELGILDFLKSKMEKEMMGFSVNKLAETISAFTGISQGSAQSYLNPLFSRNVDQSKSPYRSDRTANKVKNQIVNLGFKTDSTTNSMY